MRRPLCVNGEDTLRAIIKRNTDPEQKKEPLFGVFRRAAAYRKVPAEHRDMLNKIRFGNLSDFDRLSVFN